MTGRCTAVVIGGGIGGMTTAIGLGRAGLDVKVVEIGHRGERTGTGISLLGNTLRALDEIGIVDDCLTQGCPVNGVVMLDKAGNVLRRDPSPNAFRPEGPAGLGILRPVLAEILERHAIASGVNIRYETTMTALDQDEGGVDVTLSDGSRHRADLVVAADGVYSPTRAMVFGDHLKPVYAGQGGWRLTVSRPEHVDAMYLFAGDGAQSVGCIPLSASTCYFFFLENTATNVRMPKDQLGDLLRERLSGFTAPMIQDAIAEIGEDNVHYRPFDIQFVPPAWHKGRIVLLGDAAHSLTPQLTSGGGMAIEDAAVLTRLVKQLDDIPAALAHYSEVRPARVKPIYDASHHICQTVQKPGYDQHAVAEVLGKAYRFLAEPF